MPHPHRESFLSRIAPGLLLAATGVGVGDLAGAGFAGKELGLAVLWAVAFGALLKFGLTEGIARWQLATGSSLVQGVARHVGRGALWTFLVYLVWWSYALSIAFATGCGIATHALLERAVPASALPSDPSTARFLLGAAHAVGGLLLVAIGGYRWFERIMEVAIATMFLVVISTAVAIQPDVGAILRGLFVPSIPDANGQGFAWTLVLLGGVGGTVTILGYGYWIR
ncbi:MAG TPA: Nramp family divalent metal transporter, partial [Planctomycetota bacterium]|nr:Nramp family divalent metal transporter [Planctomycetota bacterium]